MKWVYFFRPVGQAGPIKIGCSRNPEGRMAAYQIWSPDILEIIARIPGDRTLECRFHARFRHLHSHHEWFRAAPELEAAVQQINGGTFDVATLPPAKRLPGNPVTPLTPPSEAARRYRRFLSESARTSGFDPPHDVRLASWRLFDPSGRGRDEAIRLIENHLADPSARGRPIKSGAAA